MMLAVFGGRAALSIYHAQQQQEEDRSASKKDNTPDWHLVGRFLWSRLASGTEARMGIYTSPNEVSEYVVHRRNMG